jgi:hypothetical protein
MTPQQRDRYAAEFAPRPRPPAMSPLQKLLDARQSTEAARQALRRAEHLEAVAAAELSALATMCNAPTSRPPAMPSVKRVWKTVEHDDCPGPVDYDGQQRTRCMCGWVL